MERCQKSDGESGHVEEAVIYQGPRFVSTNVSLEKILNFFYNKSNLSQIYTFHTLTKYSYIINSQQINYIIAIKINMIINVD